MDQGVVVLLLLGRWQSGGCDDDYYYDHDYDTYYHYHYSYAFSYSYTYACCYYGDAYDI